MSASWRRMTLSSIATASALLVFSAIHGCPVSTFVTSADPYVACNEAVGGALKFVSPSPNRVNQKLFCSSSSCLALWYQIKALDLLSCFKNTNTDNYELWRQEDADNCFANKGRTNNSLKTISAPNTAFVTLNEATDTRSRAVDGALGPGTVSPPNYQAETRSEDNVWVDESISSTSKNTATSITAATSNGTMSPEAANTNASGSGAATDGYTSDDSTANVWVYSGASVSAAVVVYLFVYLRRRTQDPQPVKNGGNPVQDNYIPSRCSYSLPDATISTSVPSSRFAFWDDEVINSVRVPIEKVSREMIISRGGYGEVYRGTFRNMPVAIKMLLPEKRKNTRQIQKFLAEVKMMAKLKHEHIVEFIGVAWGSPEELCALSEFMEAGDLRSLLANYHTQENIFPKGFNFDKIRIALHVAQALMYMHSLKPMVLHRDLKSRNILLDGSLNAKLTDFGVSRERADTTMTAGVGSSLWMAPEVMMGGYYGEKADVYSFGVVLSELDTQTLPYAHAMEPGKNRRLPDAVIVQMMTAGQLTVQFTEHECTAMRDLGRRCVAINPEDRPSAAELKHEIHRVWRSFVVTL